MSALAKYRIIERAVRSIMNIRKFGTCLADDCAGGRDNWEELSKLFLQQGITLEKIVDQYSQQFSAAEAKGYRLSVKNGRLSMSGCALDTEGLLDLIVGILEQDG